MEGFPTAVILARRDDVFSNVNVLFRLVVPTPEMDGLQSAAGLVNVIPQRRAYRMERESEMEIFKRELLKRPLVLQPVCHAGVGCNTGCMCGMCYRDEDWVLLINQTHPKILSRLQMGADAAKAALKRGTPFQLHYKFGKLLERLHHQLFPKDNETEATLLHAEWDYAELVVRFLGKSYPTFKTLDPRTLLDQYMPPCKELIFDFADVEFGELGLVENTTGLVVRGPFQEITEDEIRTLLPGWTVNEISPLDNIGERIPETYSYAQAGRLYESFRKKKRQKSKPHTAIGRVNSSDVEMEDVGLSSLDNLQPVGHRDSYQFNQTHSEKLRRNLYPEVQVTGVTRCQSPDGHSSSEEILNVYKTSDRHTAEHNADAGGFVSSAPAASQGWQNSDMGHKSGFTPIDRLHYRDSERSGSTSASSGQADSGYAGHDSDGYNGYSDVHTGYRNSKHVPDPYTGGGPSRYVMNAHDNMAYRPDEVDEDDALKRHTEYVAKMLQEHGRVDQSAPGRNHTSDTSSNAYVSDFVNGPKAMPRKNRTHRPPVGRDVAGASSPHYRNDVVHVDETNQVAESFI